MAVSIVSTSYYPRKPKVVCTAASLSELADYVGVWAEGSEATISETKYVLDDANGWVVPGESGKELPALPSSNGEYVLTVTVSGDTKTLSWEVPMATGGDAEA